MASHRLLPFIRHLSPPVSALLLRTPLTANHVTFLSLAAGLAASAFMAAGTRACGLAGAGLLLLCYVLDNCDGEIARARGQTSEFGDRLDSFVDWAVHTAFFPGLGAGQFARTGEPLWLWLGLIAAAGGTINYAVGLVLKGRGTTGEAAADPSGNDEFAGMWDVVLFVFRELTRADFCFIVLALELFDVSWVLLPAAAIGAQVYWITQPFARTHKV